VNISQGIARAPNEGEGLSVTAAPQIGSWHPGVANFLFADGSVRALPSSTSLTTLTRLGDVADGQVVDLP
jgi:prepilin-type processing-associated H-X9-DG protein